MTSYVPNKSTEGSARRGGTPYASGTPCVSLDAKDNIATPNDPPTTASEAVRRARAAWAPVSQQLSLDVGLDEERGQ